MNQKIRELFEQHTVSAFFVGTDFDLSKNSKGEYTNPTLEDHWQTFQEAAELIIRECEKVISDGRYSDMACEGNSHRVSYNNGRYGASSDIKKHFGVEEPELSAADRILQTVRKRG